MRLVSQKRLDQEIKRIAMGRTADEILNCAAADFKQRYAENPESTEDQLIQNIADHLALCRMIINSYEKAKGFGNQGAEC
jgi:hypothetical protein